MVNSFTTIQDIQKLRYLLILFVVVFQASSQEAARPFLRNFPPSEYRGNQQNWAVVQDKRGIMYFGNNDGVLEFDGVSWRLTKLPIVRTVAIDSSGILYVGLENDMGYLKHQTDGSYQYESLKNKIPERYRELTTVLYAYAVGEKIIFFADDKLYILENGQIKVLTSENGFHHLFKVRDQLYVRERGKGLLYFEKDTLQFIEGSELFGSEKIYTMLPLNGNEILIGTRTKGIIVYSPDRQEKFYKPEGFEKVDAFLKINPVYCGTILNGKEFAIGALTGGIILFNSTGEIKNSYNKSNGLQDNTIYWLFADRNRQLWAALDNGISLIPVELPFRNYTESNNLNGSPMCTGFSGNHFYVGTSQYLHIQKQNGNFEPIKGTEGQNFQLYEGDGSLLLASYQGVFEIKGDLAVPLTTPSSVIALTFCSLREHPGKLLLGSADKGFLLMEKSKSSWKLKQSVGGFRKPIYDAVEDREGNIWIWTAVDLYKLRLNASLDSVILWQQYTTRQGLPSNFAYPVKMNSGEVVFGTEKGIARYLPDKDLFEPHPDFSMLTGKILPFVPLKDGSFWFEELADNGNYEKGILKYVNGKYELYKKPFYKFTEVRCYESPFAVQQAPDNTIFICTSSGLLRYDPSEDFTSDQSFMTLIRRVFSGDSMIYEETGSTPDNSGKSGEVKIPYIQNDLIFHFAATNYENAEKNLYSFRLNGSDESWSAWESDHKKEYTRLREGRYRFEVRSMNQYQASGSTASFSFRIMPPWYRTLWAYLGYVLLACFTLYSWVGFRTRRLKQHGEMLEKVVEQRTLQIQEQKNNVEKLSRVGRDITSSLSTENIIHTVYENVNTLMDAAVFTIGLYNEKDNSLEFSATIENNRVLPAFSLSLEDEERLAVWCFNQRKEVIINNYSGEYTRYVSQMTPPIAGESPESILYLPLWHKEKVTGVITAQSFVRNAYSDYQINILRNLATYCAIALENAGSYNRLTALLNELKATQDILVTQSKLAALGTLTAGIAHEIKNPLNFVNNFAALNTELAEELEEKLKTEKDRLSPDIVAEFEDIIRNIKDNAGKIREHGQRADNIVRSMLQHARVGSGEFQSVDINILLDEAVNLTYHGMRAQDEEFNVKIEKSFDRSAGKIRGIPQELSRALLNIINNSFYETHRKKLLRGSGYSPMVAFETRQNGDKVIIRIRDNGDGITEGIRSKIFTPFVTTKPAGQGTGLGLSIAYDIIVHQHKGQISFETKEGSYTEFEILLPCS